MYSALPLHAIERLLHFNNFPSLEAIHVRCWVGDGD